MMFLKTLYLECNMGASGDMVLAALVELVGDGVVEKLNDMGIEGVRFEAKGSVKCGIAGTHVDVVVDGCVEGAADLGGGHVHHHGMALSDVTGIINGLNMPQRAKDDAVKIYNIVAEAEAVVHKKAVDLIHFHELGQMDAIADIAGVCLLMDCLAVDRVVVSGVNTGFGCVRCAHGVLPVPAPATAYILKGVPVYAGGIEGELTTPTGAAVIKYFADDFGRMPQMTVEKIGYGMGFKDFAAANCVRAFLGEACGCVDGANEEIAELSCNLDDMTPEALGYAVNVLMENSALDVFTVAAQMKKNRPGFVLVCLCRVEEADRFAALLLKHTTTFGVRMNILKRYALDRTVSTVDTVYGSVRLKTGEGFGVRKTKPEFDDVAALARDNGVDILSIYNTVYREVL
jgi:uncharacterized protein (TIGR00299 family) protein